VARGYIIHMQNSRLTVFSTLPIVILITFIEVIICFSTASLVMLELMPKFGQHYPNAVLVAAIITAIGTQAWLLFNHKIRKYLKNGSD
jgi:hypothetical protein